MSTFTQKIILIAALVIWLIGYNLWQFAWHGFFYHCNAVAILLLFIFIRDVVKDKWLSIFANIGVAISINNLIDELFFDPKVFALNEYILVFISILIIIRNGREKR